MRQRQKRILLGWNVVHAVIGGCAIGLGVNRSVSDCYFYLGMLLVCVGCGLILTHAALFAGWHWRKPGERITDFKRRIKAPHAVTRAKNRPVTVSPRAQLALWSGASSVVWAIIITV